MAFALPAPDGSIQIGYVLEKGLYKAIRDEWIDRLLTLVDDEVGACMQIQRQSLRPSLLNVVSFVMDRWCRPGFVAIGDAVHPMSPAGGQGIAMALIDALRLAEALTANGVGDRAQVVDSACLAFTSARASEVRNVQKIQRKLASVYLQKTWLSRFMVRFVAPCLSRLAPSILARGIAGPPRLRRSAEQVTSTASAARTA